MKVPQLSSLRRKDGGGEEIFAPHHLCRPPLPPCRPALDSNSHILSLSLNLCLSLLCLSQQSLVSTMYLHNILFYSFFLFFLGVIPHLRNIRQIKHDLPSQLVLFGLIPDCS